MIIQRQEQVITTPRFRNLIEYLPGEKKTIRMRESR